MVMPSCAVPMPRQIAHDPQRGDGAPIAELEQRLEPRRATGNQRELDHDEIRIDRQ